MISQEPLPFIKKYIEIINDGLKRENQFHKLSRTQMLWLGFCLMGNIAKQFCLLGKIRKIKFEVLYPAGLILDVPPF